MKLDSWMRANGCSSRELAEAMVAHLPEGERCSAKAVEKWRYGQRTPRKSKMQAIVRVTAGEVTANDFADLPGEAVQLPVLRRSS
ncbi:hypothetical protein [Methylobacterium sp. JK268]